jgi:ribosomal protein S18 acetylase RimI-like enzyme
MHERKDNMAHIREFQMEDYQDVVALWQVCGLQLSKSDSRESIEKILRRDPDLFLVVEDGKSIVGAVMGRYDGRRGWIQHLAVSPDYQSQGFGRQLLQEVENRLSARGCEKVNLLVTLDNASVRKFYRQVGYSGYELILMEKWLQ